MTSGDRCRDRVRRIRVGRAADPFPPHEPLVLDVYRRSRFTRYHGESTHTVVKVTPA